VGIAPDWAFTQVERKAGKARSSAREPQSTRFGMSCCFASSMAASRDAGSRTCLLGLDQDQDMPVIIVLAESFPPRIGQILCLHLLPKLDDFVFAEFLPPA